MEAKKPDKPCRGKGGTVRTIGQEMAWRFKADKEPKKGLNVWSLLRVLRLSGRQD